MYVRVWLYVYIYVVCVCVCNCVFLCVCVPACILCIRVHVYVTGEREGGKESLLGSLEADWWSDRSLRPTVPASGRRLTESWNLRRKRRDAASLRRHGRGQSTLDHQLVGPQRKYVATPILPQIAPFRISQRPTLTGYCLLLHLSMRCYCITPFFLSPSLPPRVSYALYIF